MSKQQPKARVSEPFHFRDENGKPINVTADGSLGILAAGYKGVLVWKQEFAKAYEEKMKTEKKSEDNGKA